MMTDYPFVSNPDDPAAEKGPEWFLLRLKPVPEYRGPEFWYRCLAALAEERNGSGSV